MVQRGKKIKEIVLKNKVLKMEISNLQAQLTGKDTKKETSIKNKIKKLEDKIFYPERIKYDLKVCKGCKYEHICIADLSDILGDVINNSSVIEVIDNYLICAQDRENFKEAENNYKNSLACLKSIFPLKDAIYLTDKYIVQTKIKKNKNEYLSFEIKNID